MRMSPSQVLRETLRDPATLRRIAEERFEAAKLMADQGVGSERLNRIVMEWSCDDDQ